MSHQVFLPDDIEAEFTVFPEYARFLLDHKLDDYIKEQLSITRTVNLPLLRFFESYSEEQMLAVGRNTSMEFLSAISRNKIREFITVSVNRWINGQVTALERNEVMVEDILCISLIRKRTLSHFFPAYTSDINTCVKLMQEIDEFVNYTDTICFRILLDMQQDLYKKAQMMAQMGNWTWDLKSGMRTWSDELFKMYGLEKGRYAPGDLERYNHPEDKAMISSTIRDSISSLSPYDFYYRIILDNGEEKFLHAKGEVKTDDDGKPEMLFGTLQDVTVQKNNEYELQEKQNFIQKITDITPSIILAYNLPGDRFVFVNQSLEKQLGYTTEEVENQSMNFFIGLIHPDDLPSLASKYQRISEAHRLDPNTPYEDEIIEFKYRILHKNGKYRWFHTYGTVFTRNRNNVVEDVVTISVDITDEVNAIVELIKKNEDLRKSEERYYGMVNEVEDYAIILLNKDGIIENWNKGAEKIKGYTAEEAIGNNFRLFYTEDDKKNNIPEKLLKQAVREGRSVHEGWRVRKNETIFWGSTAITSLHDKHKNIIGFSKVTRDLTERKLAEDKQHEYTKSIEEKNKRLEQVNKELESFSYMASHDLQEPLRKIQAFSNRLMQKEYAVLSEWGKDIFSRIQSSANRMQNLIEALLNFSQINSTPESFVQADINELLREVRSNMNDLIDEKKAVITAAALPKMNVIPFYFQQLLTNIISNALKYSKPGIQPQINITASLVDGKNTNEQGIVTDQKFHCISISDNGIGFDQQYATKIFELFQRLHGKSEYAGTGIGLAICKKIVEIHHGFITAQSEPGEGSTFNLFFPAAEQ